MAQRNATVVVEGQVVKHERKSGTMQAPEDPARTITWDYILARVLTSQLDVVEVQFPVDGSVPVPQRDDVVRLWCDARSSSGNLKLTVQVVEAALVSSVATGKG